MKLMNLIQMQSDIFCSRCTDRMINGSFDVDLRGIVGGSQSWHEMEATLLKVNSASGRRSNYSMYHVNGVTLKNQPNYGVQKCQYFHAHIFN